MNIEGLIPLVAFAAYLPLLGILLANRPWQRRHKLLLLYLIPAIVWSSSDFLARGFYTRGDLLDVVLCSGIWMGIGFFCFFYSFYQAQGRKAFLAYVWLVAAVVLASLGLLGHIDSDTGAVTYGVGLLPLAVSLTMLFFRGTYSLVQKFRFSPDAAERNQISYLFFGMALLAVFGFVSFIPFFGHLPLAHIGNLAMACILTYAVVTHRLVDVKVIARRAIIYVVLYGSGIGTLLLVVGFISGFGGKEIDPRTAAVIIGLGIPFVLLVVQRVRALWQRKVEQAFIGARYSYRRQLSSFIDKIYDVPTLDRLGREFTSLLAKSLDCRRACLLVAEAENEWFGTRFFHPPVENNPMKDLRLKWDSPVVTWLAREKRMLPERNLVILPEFQSMWGDEREETQLAGVAMFVPLMNNGKLVAVLAVSEKADGRPYALEDIDLLESVTAQVAASMENRYSDEQLREQDAQTSLVNRLTAIITSSMSIQMIFEAFAQELKNVVDIDWATIALIDGDELHFVALSSTIGSAWHPEERIPLKGTATELACRERRAVYEPDLKRHHRFWTWENHLKQGISSIVSLPLSVTDRVIGTLILASRTPGAYSRGQIALLERVALQIAAPVENAQLYALAEQKSRIDELTGLFNRRHFEERLKEEIARHSRYDDPFSLFIIDLDNFKTYNDVYGHPAGDTLLGEIGTIIKNSVRDADQAFRYGGDEFVVILPQTIAGDAQAVAERVRGQIADEMEKRSLTVTCSIGLASYPADGVIAGELVVAADTALYYAKWTGGNRTYSSSKAASDPSDDARTHGKRDGLSAVYALVAVVEARDPYVYGHSRRVNTYAVVLAEAIGLSPDEVSRVSTAALLHDIGKIGIPDEVLNKKAKLTAENWEAIRAHPRLGTNIVSNIPQLLRCADSILHHHERWDGSGYPEGLKGDQIPLESRILAIADSFEAMSSARPYRPALSREEVMDELKKGAGTQFDPNLVEVFIGIIEAGLPERVKIGNTGHLGEPTDS